MWKLSFRTKSVICLEIEFQLSEWLKVSYHPFSLIIIIGPGKRVCAT